MIIERIQALIDRQVEGSPRARQLLTQLDGRRMHVVVRHTPWQLTVRAQEGQLRLARSAAGSEQDGALDVRLEGTPLALLALLREDPATVIRRGDVALRGDGDAGTRFQELAALLQPDLEGELARLIGDIPAYGLGSLLRKALAYGRASVTTQMDNVGEYLAHERRLLVPQAEARQFLQDVDTLRENTDRLAARIARLEAGGGRT